VARSWGQQAQSKIIVRMAAWAKAHPTTAYAESIFWVPAPDQVGGKHTKKKEYPISNKEFRMMK